MEDRGDRDYAPPARRPAAESAAAAEAELGGPGPARGPAQRDTESAAPGPRRDLRELTAELRGLPAVSAGQITYDLRRLRSHHLIERIPRTHRYHVTGTGLHTAMILTRMHDRVLPATTGPPGRLRAAATAYQAAIDDIIHDAGLAA